MLKKIGIFLCALILIPTITYAKLNKMEFISETSMPGKRKVLKETDIYIQKNKLLFVDRAGNILQEEPYDNNYTLEYADEWDKILLFNPKTGEGIVKNRNYNTITKNTSMPCVKNTRYDDEYMYTNDYTNGIYDTYIYDKNLKLIAKLDDNYAYKPNVYEDRIVTVDLSYRVISRDPFIDKSEHTVKVYDRKGKLLKTQVFTSPEKLYNHIELTANGNFLLLSDSKESVTLYNSLTMEKVKEISNIEKAEIIGDAIYLFNAGTLNTINGGNKEEIAKIRIPSFDESLTLTGEVTYDEYEKIYWGESTPDDDPISYKTRIAIENAVEKYNGTYTNVEDVIEYRNEYYAIAYSYGGNTKLFHLSKDLKEIESNKLNRKILEHDYIMEPLYLAIDNNDIVAVSYYDIPESESLPKPNSNYELPAKAEPYPTEYLNTHFYHRYKIIGEPYNITTNIKGKGTIEVPKSSQPNEMVNLNVKPAEGYTIANIYIVDDNGKRINLTNNNFKMPEGNITLEVEFTVINPETITHNTYFIIAFISLLTILILLVKINKVNKYENL